jgi:hypothetical protein
MKRVVLLFVIGVITLSLSSLAAEAQRSGSMQATARVVETREGWAGLQVAREATLGLANGQQSSATVSTALSRISVHLPVRPEDPPGQPRTAFVTINYLRN